MTDLDRRAGTTGFALSGDIDLTTADGIRGAASAAVAHGAAVLRLDLRDVTFMDSQGLSALIDAHRALEAVGVELVLADPPAPVRRVLEVSGLDQVLHTTTGRPDPWISGGT